MTAGAAAPVGSSRIDREAVTKAADALFQWLRSRDSKEQLFEDDEFLYLQISLHRFPSNTKSTRVNPHLLPAPHPLFSDHSSSLCLFFDDRSPSASASALLDRARELSLSVDAAIGLSSLRSDYRPYEARRRLCDSHNLFFADRRIIPLLPRLIGKEFFRKRKAPLPLDLSRPCWPLQLRRCLNSAFFYPPSKGTCTVVKVGRASMTPEEIADNVIAIVEGAVEHVPKGWGNVRSVLMKAAGSVALPVFQALPQMGLKINVPAYMDVDKKKGMEHDVEHDGEGEVVDVGEVGEQLSGQKMDKQRKNKKGRIHELITRYMKMDGGAKDDDNGVQENENGEEGNDKEVEKSAMKKKRKQGTKKKEEAIRKKGKKDNKELCDDGEQDDYGDGIEGDGDKSSAGVSLNNKMKRKKGKVDKQVEEENDGEQLEETAKADGTKKKIKKTRNLEKLKKIKKSKMRQS
ncbi:hypothetical protein BHE74_00017720 [Ensete ventricosum]|uniref:Uncharacterized protein n=1 Tax=Ensete ventricosum TaxID=4639 RepID=A0A445M9K6_ENSVE|nr:hypothetical protein BHE74_00017720 [Ensete ventricosum]RZR70916.1 hypothetical protein BHM03_00002325 [Ensete ventricosum]